MSQIKDFIGSNVIVTAKDGWTYRAKLQFFNFNTQVIHLEYYSRGKWTFDHKPNWIEECKGKFIVLNQDAWEKLEIDEVQTK